jgi:glycosyltransferase involved in cell wall biosynthesis
MKLSIITPCLNHGKYLPLAVASVADQGAVKFEHIIADGGSTDETVAWLKTRQDLRWFSAPDKGMYDAINKGLLLATGEIIGYLNCDEQYLPGTLSAVVAAFKDHPEADLLYGNMLLVQPCGKLLAYRKSYPLRWPYIAAAHLYIPSCALFWRRDINDSGLMFDTRWRIQGDADFVMRALRARHRAIHLRRYLAVFTISDSNLGNTPAAQVELLAARREAPWWVRFFRAGWEGSRRLEKLLSGAHHQQFPFSYEIYTRESLPSRCRFTALQGTFQWPLARHP